MKCGDKEEVLNFDTNMLLEKNTIFDHRCIDVYEYVIQNHVEVTLRNGNWAQEFYRLDEMMTYIIAQFSDKEFIQNILTHNTNKMDNAFIIDNLLEQEEDIRIAFKANPNIDTIGKTITAFINTQEVICF